MKAINHRETKKSGVNPIVAGATGAVIGAGVAIAGAAVLNDEKNRARVKKVLVNAKNRAQDYINDSVDMALNDKSIVEGEIVKGKKHVKKVTKTIKKQLADKK